MRQSLRLFAACAAVLVLAHAPPARAASDPGTAHPALSALPVVEPINAAQMRRMLAAHRGPLLVNLWATWCAPCRAEFPGLLRIARQRAPKGLRLLLVSADFPDQLLDVRRFLYAQGVRETTYIKSGDDMEFIAAIERKWSGALPATLVLDRAGRRSAFWEGEADEARFASAADAALKPHPRNLEK